MSHPQAFHTSCRSGLSGISGFQMNAASPRLDAQQLAALAGAHARYTAPGDVPYEPTAEDMRRFPVALKMSVVPSVGPVVSRTVYVGREYRGRDGQPDEGRFGNYFCHMVAGAAAGDPFDGLAAIELWDAGHWTTDESADLELPELGQLMPGPLDVTVALATVAAAPAGVAAALLGGALRALDGGAPLLIVDPDPERAARWLAWITYALPADLAPTLTFSTFEGRPGDADGLHVVATTPACDGGALLGNRFARVDVTQSVPEREPLLYARVASALALDDAETLLGAVRRVGAAPLAERGASLAIAGGMTALADDADLPAVLAVVQGLAASGRVDEAAAAATALEPSETGDRAVLEQWARVYALARAASAGAARELATAALLRLLANVDALPPDMAAIPADAPSAPTVAGIGAWIRATEAARGTDASGRMITVGVRLALLGLNVPVDDRATAVIVDDLHHDSMQRALAAIAASGRFGPVIAQVTEAVAGEPAASPKTRARLLSLCRYPEARDAIRARAERLRTFDAEAIWQRTRVQTGLATPAEAARELAPKAVDEGAYADMRELWGLHGPRTEVELDDLLLAYLDAGATPPQADCERAFRVLMEAPLPRQSPQAGIGFTLGKLPTEVRLRADFWAWAAAFSRPDSEFATPLVRWAGWAARGIADGGRVPLVPDARRLELVDIAGETLAHHRNDPTFFEALREFEGRDFEQVCDAIGRALAPSLRASTNPIDRAVREFEYWCQVPGVPRLIDTVLPAAFEQLSTRDMEDVASRMSPRYIAHWTRWTELHPRTGARAKVARAFRRLGKDRSEVDA